MAVDLSVSALREEFKERTFRFWRESQRYRDYGSQEGLPESPFRPRLSEWLNGAGRVLDLACGDGDNLPHLPAGIAYTGCDVSEAALRRLAERRDHTEFEKTTVACDIEAVPLPDASFDAVISTYSFEHFLNVPRVLAECDRLLAPGGRLIAFGPDFSMLNNFPPPLSGRLLGRRLRLAGYSLRRLARRAAFGRGRALFEYVEPMRLEDETFLPDHDATHLTDYAGLAKYMAAIGYEAVELKRASRPAGRLRGWLAARRLWGPAGDAVAVLRKPTAATRQRRVKVTEVLIHRQPHPDPTA